MSPAPPDYAAFAAWLLERGRSPLTARAYVTQLREAWLASETLEARLVRKDLAPKSRQVAKFAIKAWYRFQQDRAKLEAIDDYRLPRGERVTVKSELAFDVWKRLVDQIAKAPASGVKYAALLLALRGFRVGDVMRMTPADIKQGLDKGKITFLAKGGRRLTYDVMNVQDALEGLRAFGAMHLPRWTSVGELCGLGAKKAVAAGLTRLRRALHRWASDIGVTGVYPHVFRRTYATYFLKEMHHDPQALIKLQRHMGWADIATAALYADHVAADELTATAKRLIATVRPRKR